MKAKTNCGRLFHSTYIFCENRFCYRFCSASDAENKCICSSDRGVGRDTKSVLLCSSHAHMSRTRMYKYVKVDACAIFAAPKPNHTMCAPAHSNYRKIERPNHKTRKHKCAAVVVGRFKSRVHVVPASIFATCIRSHTSHRFLLLISVRQFSFHFIYINLALWNCQKNVLGIVPMIQCKSEWTV